MADQENREYTLLEIWRGNAYSAQKTQKEAKNSGQNISQSKKESMRRFLLSRT